MSDVQYIFCSFIASGLGCVVFSEFLHTGINNISAAWSLSCVCNFDICNAVKFTCNSLVPYLCIDHRLLWQTVTANSQQMSQGFSTALPSFCKTPCVFAVCIPV